MKARERIAKSTERSRLKYSENRLRQTRVRMGLIGAGAVALTGLATTLFFTNQRDNKADLIEVLNAERREATETTPDELLCSGYDGGYLFSVSGLAVRDGRREEVIGDTVVAATIANTSYSEVGPTINLKDLSAFDSESSVIGNVSYRSVDAEPIDLDSIVTCPGTNG